jgi:microcystin-dependent protein
MSDPFIGEIRMFAGKIPPSGWAFCDGQLLAVSQNNVLFQVFGTRYGGDGTTTFGLPDLRGRVPVHAGDSGGGPGLTDRGLGDTGGAETATIAEDELPPHTHAAPVSDETGTRDGPSGGLPARLPSAAPVYAKGTPLNYTGPMAEGTLGTAGGAQAHDNVQPFLCIQFMVALTGTYPAPS